MARFNYSQHSEDHYNAMKLRNWSFDYKTIWLMLYVLPLSMSSIFRLVIFFTIVTLVSHLYYGIAYKDALLYTDSSKESYHIFYLGREHLAGVIILSLVLARHLGR